MKIGDIKVEGKKKWELVSCHRCGGSGIYSSYHGECFRCNGVGFDTSKDWFRIDEEAVKNRAKYAEKKRKENAEKFKLLEEERAYAWDYVREASLRVFEETMKAEAKYEAYVDLDDDAYINMSKSEREAARLDYAEEFLVHTLSDGIMRFRNTKDWIIEKAERLLDNRDEKEEKYNAAEDVPTGKVVITGEVLSTKFKDNGFGGGNLKGLILDDRGFKVWGTISSKMMDSTDGGVVGKRFSFEANVDASPDDPKFGFYKRPSKVEAI